ncbi:hypothetical protein ES319_D06G189900v1 [Gossypium barbadense]|uniref:Uncharacterized protein n=2 Tax=Gossypium TaxID=3633 RepID=A0A5J5R3G3_GOSBA|nr:hypothetical protein ES319_D06G189900v1 [Gossypium barbadense]TYG65633.1 hypothetical protein ES288_D06G201700v1 [Gossypium darwinii]
MKGAPLVRPCEEKRNSPPTPLSKPTLGGPDPSPDSDCDGANDVSATSSVTWRVRRRRRGMYGSEGERARRLVTCGELGCGAWYLRNPRVSVHFSFSLGVFGLDSGLVILFSFCCNWAVSMDTMVFILFYFIWFNKMGWANIGPYT